MDKQIFDQSMRQNPQLSDISGLMNRHGCSMLFFKILSPNDNSKNQPWLGNHLLDLDFFPVKEITARNESKSNKKKESKRSQIFEAAIDLKWMDANGNLYPAPSSKFIYYPQYPEVRLSGFLRGCPIDANGWFTHEKPEKGRAVGRVLIFGKNSKDEIFAYLSLPGTQISEKLTSGGFSPVSPLTSVFFLIPTESTGDNNSKEEIINVFRKIHRKGWITSKRLDRTGTSMQYTAINGVGYTLEAELGVIPNGEAAPDFLGWEVKAFTIKNSDSPLSSEAITVMTPEPTGGFYKMNGASSFVMKYGHETSTPGKFYFTGSHTCSSRNDDTGLILQINGFDPETNELFDVEGFLALVDSSGEHVAIWHFSKILQHWMKKHSRAVYVPAVRRKGNNETFEYNYSRTIHLFIGTSIEKLLAAYSKGSIYYDPGVKVENGKVKARSQFRVKFRDLHTLYVSHEAIDLENEELR